ncbi:hypothetical protein Lac1_08740 [Claveliimonas bilis]|uniref:Uncharacterized protein n=1 Tax=Claveliimonas bilis TaxID=3028070 RepID=A0ABN6Z0L5_9FIRM|nr:hypothetical protein Lac1_08740 [Claveliimonas bilis]
MGVRPGIYSSDFCRAKRRKTERLEKSSAVFLWLGKRGLIVKIHKYKLFLWTNMLKYTKIGLLRYRTEVKL